MSASDLPSSERELVLRAREGDTQAIAELFTRFWRASRAAAYAVIRDISRAEDVASDAFGMALTGLKRLRDPDRFGPWLRKIVVRTARRELMAASRLSQVSATPTESAPDAGEALERRRFALLIADAVEGLPPAEREAALLFYFEGYSTEEAARFVDVPVGTIRRRLHDGRARLRRTLTAVLNGQPDDRVHTQLYARVQGLLHGDATHEQWYDVMRRVLLRRPVPHRALASLTEALSNRFARHPKSPALIRRVIRRDGGPLFEDPGPVGDTARALREDLSDFEEWVLDATEVLDALPAALRRDQSGRVVGAAQELMPPALSSPTPRRSLRATRGLLFGDPEGIVMDPAELLVRSASLAAFAQGMRPAWISDVLDAYWTDDRPIELAEVEAWLDELVDRIAAGRRHRCVSRAASLRYRTALRLAFEGDGRPAAIGGVLTAWPGAPEGLSAVHVRLYLEPWAQVRSGQPVLMQPAARHAPIVSAEE